MVEVTQEDRDAAADFVRDVCELPDYSSPPDQPNLICVTTEELDDLALEAFARHRTAALATAQAQAAELRAEVALEKARHRETLAVLQTAHDCEATALAKIELLNEIIVRLLEHSTPVGVIGDHFFEQARAALGEQQ